jgi:hypothetical protein
MATGGGLVLHDKYLNSYTSLLQGTYYDFDVTADTLSQGEQRFELKTSTLPTGIAASTGQALKVSYSPNPASEFLIVNINAATSEPTTISIYNIAGQLVYRQHVGNIKVSDIKVPLTNIMPGIHVIKVEHGSEGVTGRINKQ